VAQLGGMFHDWNLTTEFRAKQITVLQSGITVLALILPFIDWDRLAPMKMKEAAN
jgi:hypothetical protein